MSEQNLRQDKFEAVAEKPAVEIKGNENTVRIISEEDEKFLDDKIQEIKEFMSNNDGNGKSEEEKDKLYAQAQELWNELSGTSGRLNFVEFNIVLNKEQYRYLTTLLRDKIEYDVNTIFFVLPLSKFLKEEMVEQGKYENDNEIKGFAISATDMTYMYHILSQHKVKGLKNSTFLFADVIRRIGDISKIINYYENASKDLATEIQDWVACFEEGVSKEVVAKGEKLEAKTE